MGGVGCSNCESAFRMMPPPLKDGPWGSSSPRMTYFCLVGNEGMRYPISPYIWDYIASFPTTNSKMIQVMPNMSISSFSTARGGLATV